MANQICNEWRFKIHWNNIEWVNPINCSEGNNIFFISSGKFYLKESDKKSHWVDHS